MPLRPATPATQVKNYFVTLGPYNPELSTTTMRDEVEHEVVHEYGANFGKLASSFEVGSETPADPYYHIHLCIQLKREARWAKVNKKLRKVLEGWPKRDGEHRKVSTRFFTVGHCEDPWKVMTDYLTVPSKDKEVGEYLEFSERDYTKYDFLGVVLDEYYDMWNRVLASDNSPPLKLSKREWCKQFVLSKNAGISAPQN